MYSVGREIYPKLWEDVLSRYTFTAGTKDKSISWFSNIEFLENGLFTNTEKSIGLHHWKFKKDRIETFKKTGEITQIIFFDSIVATTGYQMKLNFHNKPLNHFNLLWPDGQQMIRSKRSEKYYMTSGGSIIYENENRALLPIMYGHFYHNIKTTSRYKLSFDIRIEDTFSFIENDILFCISPIRNNVFDILDDNTEKISINFENITSRKWKHIEKMVSFSSDKVVLGPCLAGTGKAEFKNIFFQEVG